ncbi:MAG: arabinan endo-1,5-alpha-L-arabinosidase [Lachnospiraceae bacterium]|nr:arabinan endo-1,5-alpha-L-arabinosidase [Lachnospiraceae bacterium]
MSTNFSLKHPYILADEATEKYYCYGDGSDVFVSDNLKDWEPAQSELPQLNQPAVIKVRNEYRIYTVTDDGILLYVSDTPTSGFHVRDYVITYDDNSFEFNHNRLVISHPSVISDPITREHYLVYGCCHGGVKILHLNPRNGLAFVDGPGITIAKAPEFNSRITDGYIYYNENDKSYYLFATYGSDKHGSVRVGKSSHINGPYLDCNRRDMADTNNFDDTIGYMILAPMHFDDCTFVYGYSRPVVFKDFNNKLHLSVYVYNSDEEDGIVSITDLLTTESSNAQIPFLPVPFGMELCGTPCDTSILPSNVCGPYEYINLTKEVPLPLNDYNPLSLLQPSEQGVSSTRNSWALAIPHKAGGRVELGGSLRGYWIISNDNKLIIRYNNTVEEYISVPVKISSTSVQTTLLIGFDNNGNFLAAKKY